MDALEKSIIKEKHIASLQEHPIRLQQYGVGIFKTIPTRSALKKAIKKNLIYVDDHIATTATLIRGGEIISFHQPTEISNKREFLLQLEVVFEDDHLALINKPAGVQVSGNAFKTVANALGRNLKKSTQSDAVDPKPAHRLDFPTTGLLLVGKTTTSISSLNALFQNKQVTKIYFAVTIGKMKEVVEIAIAIDGKRALSTFEVIKTIPSKRFGWLSLVKLSPKTGRRHQLRKHMAAIGNPILGDSDYGLEGLILKGKGLYLHAFSLEFVHPITKDKMYFEKELPKKFDKLFSDI